MTPHLTEQELYALLDNPATPNVHAATCPHCTRQLAELRTSFASLRVSLTALSQFRPSPAPARARVHPRAWALSAACLLLGAAALPALHHLHPAAPAPAHLQQPSPELDDEALLQGVAQDLSNPIAPSLNPLAPTVR